MDNKSAKEVLEQYNDKLICFDTVNKTNDGAAITNYVIVVDGKAYLLYCYKSKEFFGINYKTGNPRVLIGNISPSVEDLKSAKVVPMNEAILSALCNVLKTQTFDKESETEIKIGPITCEVRMLQRFKEKKLSL